MCVRPFICPFVCSSWSKTPKLPQFNLFILHPFSFNLPFMTFKLFSFFKELSSPAPSTNDHQIDNMELYIVEVLACVFWYIVKVNNHLLLYPEGYKVFDPNSKYFENKYSLIDSLNIIIESSSKIILWCFDDRGRLLDAKAMLDDNDTQIYQIMWKIDFTHRLSSNSISLQFTR